MGGAVGEGSGVCTSGSSSISVWLLKWEWECWLGDREVDGPTLSHSPRREEEKSSFPSL